MENKRTELSRRDFGKLMMGAGAAATIAPLTLTDLNAEQKDKAIKEIRSQFAVSGMESPIKINADYQGYQEWRIALAHPDSRNVANYKGEVKPWPLAENDHRQKQINESMNGPDIPATDRGEARAGRALEAAGWTVNEMCGNLSPNRNMLQWEPLHAAHMWPHVFNAAPDETDPDILTNRVKYCARMAGADLVGVAKLNKNWVHTEVMTTKDPESKAIAGDMVKKVVWEDCEKPHEREDAFVIPNSCQSVIVSGIAMNREMIQTGPTSMECAAASFGYSRMIHHDMIVAQFIRALGYYAIPACSGMGTSISFAIDAGLGQASRMGLLITPEFGPALRLTKIFTNMPITPDKPIDFGVHEFCETCKKCARECPSKAISTGPQSYEARSIHSANGKLQWQSDQKKCLEYWVESGGDCGTCIAVCPFTKGNIWIHDGVEWLIDHARFLDPLMLGMDDALGYGERRTCKSVWEGKINTYGLDTDHFQDTESYGKDRGVKS